MAGRKKSAGAGDTGGGWANTYANMATLLLAFVILLYSMSAPDTARFNLLAEAFRGDDRPDDQVVIYSGGDGSLGGEAARKGDSPTNPGAEIALEDAYRAIAAWIAQSGVQDSAEVFRGDGYLFVRFLDELLFLPDSPRLKDPNMEILNIVGERIRGIEDKIGMISVNAHTAAVLGAPDYAVSDRELSGDRANVILRYLEDNVGVDGSKLIAVAWGKWKPSAPNDTEEGRTRNRRVEILISADNPVADQLDNVYEKLTNR